jgi:type II secretory pathway component PulF
LIRACESAGGAGLAGVLRTQSEEVRRESRHAELLAVARLYPFATGAVCLAPAVFIFEFIIPKFSRIFQLMPHLVTWWPSYMNTSRTALDVAVVVLGLITLGWCFAMLRARFPFFNRALSWPGALMGGRLKAPPLFSPRRRHRCLARLARALGLLLESRADLPRACRCIGNPEVAGPYADTLLELASATEGGIPLPEALRDARWPKRFTQVLLVGVAAGNLARSCEVLAEWHQARAERWNRIIAVATPFVTVPLTGLMVAAIYIPILMAILSVKNVA